MSLPDKAPSQWGVRYCWLLILVVALGALMSRVPRLSLRPMHTDEAVHADKFGDLLEANYYEYDPDEYHGPTLNYATLISAALGGHNRYIEITEATVRLVPIAFSILTIVLTVLLVRGLGWATLPIALLTAVSPAVFFYSRYYIQETLLVCFTFGVLICGYRYARTKRLGWVIAAGAFVGLMHATKETCVIALGAMGMALALVRFVGAPKESRSVSAVFKGLCPAHLLIGLLTGVGVSALFCSSFFSHPRGILDSYLTYATYLGRGGGHDTTHVHAWHYYLQMLLYSRYGGGPIWSEAAIVLLALVGMIGAWRGKAIRGVDLGFVRFMALYTVILTALYSAIPYKTPWCLLTFLHGMIVLAGVGAVLLVTAVSKPALRGIVVVLLAAGVGHLAFQSYRGSFVYQADSRNPYVYAHPTEEIFSVVERVYEYADTGLLGSAAMPLQVACVGKDYWPLPWYLRSLQVDWRSEVPARIGPGILLSPEFENDLARRLYVETPASERRMFMYLLDDPYYAWFRPEVKLVGFVRKDLWEAWYQRPDPTELIEKQRERESEPAGDAVRQQ